MRANPRINADANQQLVALTQEVARLTYERRLLAKLAADEPFNPLEAWVAKELRDKILSEEV